MASFMSAWRQRDGLQHRVDVRYLPELHCPGRATTLPVDGAATIFGILIMAAAYVAANFDNIMDMLQLVFGFVNAPCSPVPAGHVLEADHRPWRFRPALGTLGARRITATTIQGIPFSRGGWRLAAPVSYDMAQNFWTAITPGPSAS